MKKQMKKRVLWTVLSLVTVLSMLIGIMPMSAFAYWEEPTAEGNIDLETTVYDYTKPVGVTMRRLTGSCVAEYGEDGNLGDDFLFVIKSGDRYYAMKDVPASETAYTSIPAVDVTSWVNADGSLTVPADTLDVAFWRYEVRGISEYGMFVNGREDHLSYTYGYESVDGDNDYYNDAERNYWGKYVVVTYEEESYTNALYYWSENEVSGTLNFGGRWSYYISNYNSIDLKYELITDLRDNGIGGKEFYFRYLGTDVEFVGDEVEGYLYYADCRHQGTVRHAEYDAPTCMLKGCEEYWYCENCNRYAKDESFTEFFGEEMPVIPATGHDFDDEKCQNCNRPVPVYSKVTNQADFDALAGDTMFILVAEYNGKHYAMDFSEVYAYMIDSDGDGFFDIHDVDDDLDGIPDYLEFDEGGGGEWRDEPNGIYDYLEWDMDDDGDVDDYDLHEFHIMVCEQHLTDMLYNNGSIKATEITINPDGTISHEEAKKTAEFEMVDVYLAEDYNPDWHSHWENGVMPYHTKCVKQFVIPNYFLSAPSMRPIERMYQQRIYDFGDSSHWGVLFYDSREEYFSYTDGDMDEKVDADEDGKPDPLPFPDVSQEGSVAVFDTFDDIGWILYHEGQMAQLRLRDYKDTISFVTGHSWELDWEWIEDENHEDGGYYDSNDIQTCVYLYASAPYEAPHVCDFGDWYDTEDGNHRRDCTDPDCEEFETEAHDFGAWSKLDGEYHTRECQAEGCDATEKAPHTFGEWGEYADFVGITRHCTAHDCDAYETKPEEPPHVCEFGDWIPDPDNDMKHIRKCDCGASESGDHEYGDFVKKDEEYHTHSCPTCGVTEDFEHSFYDWIAKDDREHIHECMECDHASVLPHDYEREVTKEPTEIETGIATYTCSLCSHFYTEEIDKLTHVCEFGDFVPDPDDDAKHIRKCDCGKSESADHQLQSEVINWETCGVEGQGREWCEICGYERFVTRPALEHTWDEGVVTREPTAEEVGIITYTCTLCGATYTEEIPKRISEITNEDNGVSLIVPSISNAYIPDGTVFDVVTLPTEQVPEQVLGEIAVTAEGAAKPLGMFDLSLLLDGAKIQPDGTVEITLPAPDLAAEYDSIIVVYIAPDGSYEECKTTVNEDGTITFETDHFSQYAVIGITKGIEPVTNPNNPGATQDGLGTGAIIGIVLGAVVLLGGGFCLYLFVFRKKRA